tara:strand:- start:2867 stop:3457 length:591 start_codon:yes stop_codon:yes gene_type:complete
MKIKDRIKELRRVKASELIPNVKNWRTHPKAQQDALKGMLAEVGFADALIARDSKEGLILIDGHLRAETTPDSMVPVLVLDVNEKEADQILATLDPLSAMASHDQDALLNLVEGIDIDNSGVNAMIEALVNGENKPMPWDESDWNSDIEAIQDIVPENSTMDGKITISYPEHLRDEVTSEITKFVTEQNWENVQIS